MPTYDYECVAKGHRFELFQRFGETPGAECPTCGSDARRIISPVAVHFKGSGFYKTDNAASRVKKQASSEKAEGSTKKKSEKKKSDGKSDSKSTTKSSEKSTGSSSAGSD